MSNTISAFAANCRIFILVDDVLQDDFNVNPQKSFYKLNSVQTVSSTITVDSGGQATVRLNDKDMKFRKYFPFKYLNTRTFGDEKVETSNPEIAKSDLDREPLPIALTNAQEIEAYRKLLIRYGKKHSAIETLSILAKGKSSYGDEPEKYGGVLVPLFSPQNLIWIDYLGRDGYWYRKFSGIITKVDDSKSTRKTPEISLQCRTYDRLLEYSQILVGTKNIGGLSSTEIPILSNQQQTLASSNKYYGKTFSEIVVDVFKTTNDFFIRNKKIKGKDYRYFKVKDIFGFGDDIKNEKLDGEPAEFLEVKTFGTIEIPNNIKQKLIGEWTYSRITGTYYLEDKTFIYNDKGKTEQQITENNTNIKKDNVINQIGEKGYPIDDDIFKIKKYSYDKGLDVIKDFYPGSEVVKNGIKLNENEKREWIPVIMSDDFFGDKKPYQNLVRTSLTIFNTEKMTPADILKEIKSIVLAYIYFDGDGSVKIERPYFDIDMSCIMNDEGTINEIVPPDFDLRYVITQKDTSYLSHNSSDSEAQIITRVELQANPDYINFDAVTSKVLQGYSNSSLKTMTKYGWRSVVLKPIVSQGFRSSSQAEDILNSYCYAQKLLLTSDSKSLDFNLNQRPDLQLNRPMLFLDEGKVTLITSLTENFDFSKNTHTTNVKGKYTRFVGDQLINPWRKRIIRPVDIENPDGSISQSSTGWQLEDWKDIEPVDLVQQKNILGIGTDILEEIGFKDDAENYSKIKVSLQRAINDLKPDFQFEENKYTCFILRYDRANVSGFDSRKGDIIYFLWKENGVEQWERFTGSGGDPQTNESRWSKSSYGEYSKLERGIFRYANPDESSFIDNKNKIIKYKCDNFKFTKIKKNINGEFIKGTEVLNSKNISSVSDVQGRNQKLVSFLSSASIIFYNTVDGVEGIDKKICYDSLGIGLFGLGKNTGINADTFLKNINKNQTYVDVIISNFSNVNEENPNMVIGESGTDLDSSDIRNIFLYIYEINIGNITRDKNNGIKLDKENVKYSNVNSNVNYGDKRRGIYLVTKEFTNISDDEQWVDFINSKQIQDEWMNNYFIYIMKVINNKDYIINGVSLSDRINKILGLNSSNYLSVSTNKIGTVIPIYGNEGTVTPRINDFPVDSVINTMSGICGLIHLGFTDAMLLYPQENYKNIYDNHLDIVVKYLKKYFLFDEWSILFGEPFNNFKNSPNLKLSYLKNIEIDSNTLKGKIKVWEFIKLMQRITI